MHLVFPPPFPWLFLGPYTSSLIIGHNSPPAHLQCNAHVVYAAWPPPFQLPTSAVHFASSPLPPPSFFWLFSVCPTFLESTKIYWFQTQERQDCLFKSYCQYSSSRRYTYVLERQKGNLLHQMNDADIFPVLNDSVIWSQS